MGTERAAKPSSAPPLAKRAGKQVLSELFSVSTVISVHSQVHYEYFLSVYLLTSCINFFFNQILF